ncbi:uncharacterized protein B0T23DRAFT_397997 [Neurospora hispaniola]|uniref:Uncharacterized protein n=1 Tax=Neurospora hispaniola TaxID=588809 RepID=A0AAJ0I4F5_9PEZI|nr:hypothetical protein B0T23DRAFT_397997 [Neurospora hispaniola]
MNGRYETAKEFYERREMEQRAEERSRREFLRTIPGQTPHNDYNVHPQPDAPLATPSSSSSPLTRSSSQHYDTSSTDSRGNQDSGRTYNPNRRLSERVSDHIDGDGHDYTVPNKYPPLRTRTRRSATVPTEGRNSLWRPRPRNGLGVVAEDSHWDPGFNNSYLTSSPSSDDDNRTYVDYNQDQCHQYHPFPEPTLLTSDAQTKPNTKTNSMKKTD